MRSACWTRQVMAVGSGFSRAIGKVDSLIEKARAMGQCWLRGIGTARALAKVFGSYERPEIAAKFARRGPRQRSARPVPMPAKGVQLQRPPHKTASALHNVTVVNESPCRDENCGYSSLRSSPQAAHSHTLSRAAVTQARRSGRRNAYSKPSCISRSMVVTSV